MYYVFTVIIFNYTWFKQTKLIVTQILELNKIFLVLHRFKYHIDISKIIQTV